MGLWNWPAFSFIRLCSRPMSSILARSELSGALISIVALSPAGAEPASSNETVETQSAEPAAKKAKKEPAAKKPKKAEEEKEEEAEAPAAEEEKEAEKEGKADAMEE